MAKRFTDSEKWSDKWFRKLSPLQKLAWFYLCDRCDIAGVIEIDEELANFQIGDSVDWDGLIEASAGRIERISGGKVWLVKFVNFQYGSLKPESKPHSAVIKRLSELNLIQRVTKPLAKGTSTPKDKDKDQDKDQGGSAEGGKRFTPPTVAQVSAYCRERSNNVDAEQFVDFYASKGWLVGKAKMKDWRACVRTWEKNRPTHQSTNGDPRGNLAVREQLLRELDE